MDKGGTKREILDAALELFSVQGYGATSVSQIADAVGIRKASLYSHFSSKQEILDTLFGAIRQQYDSYSLFSHMDQWEAACAADKPSDVPATVIRLILEQVRFILHDPKVSRVRKMLLIVQFSDPQMAQLYTRQNYDNVLHAFTGLVERLIRQGRLRRGEPSLLAAQLCLPVTVWIDLCTRAPEREPEVETLICRHVRQFFAAYGAESGAKHA